MAADPRVSIHPDSSVLLAAIAARLITRLVDAQDRHGEATVVLTGGTTGIGTLRAVADSAAHRAVDWSKVNVWWGDERFVPASSPDRNSRQAAEALLDGLPLDPERVHVPGSSDEFATADDAAADYQRRLAEAGAREGAPLPRFDVLLLGVGPDAHIASLFPEMAGIREADALVVGVEDAPKPPPSRLSLTLPAINSAEEVWMVVSGEDKAGAVGLALAGAGTVQVPAAGARGRSRTLWLVDAAAAAKVPQNLIRAERSSA